VPCHKRPPPRAVKPVGLDAPKSIVLTSTVHWKPSPKVCQGTFHPISPCKTSPVRHLHCHASLAVTRPKSFVLTSIEHWTTNPKVRNSSPPHLSVQNTASATPLHAHLASRKASGACRSHSHAISENVSKGPSRHDTSPISLQNRQVRRIRCHSAALRTLHLHLPNPRPIAGRHAHHDLKKPLRGTQSTTPRNAERWTI
jgi:hypothetical protein